MYSYISLEERIPQDHRLRSIRKLVNQALEQLSRDFDALYSRRGRPSIPPEHLIRALLLQLLYGLRSEAQLMEQLRYNLLFRWFVGLEMDDPVWDATVFKPLCKSVAVYTHSKTALSELIGIKIRVFREDFNCRGLPFIQCVVVSSSQAKKECCLSRVAHLEKHRNGTCDAIRTNKYDGFVTRARLGANFFDF